MKAKGKFISFLLVVDTFFVAYAYGFHSRQVLVIDPKLPPVVQGKETQSKEKQNKDVQKKAIKQTEIPRNSKNIRADGKAHASAAKAGTAALNKQNALKQSAAKDQKTSSTKPGAKKSVKKSTGPATKAKDP